MMISHIGKIWLDVKTKCYYNILLTSHYREVSALLSPLEDLTAEVWMELFIIAINRKSAWLPNNSLINNNTLWCPIVIGHTLLVQCMYRYRPWYTTHTYIILTCKGLEVIVIVLTLFPRWAALWSECSSVTAWGSDSWSVNGIIYHCNKQEITVLIQTAHL